MEDSFFTLVPKRIQYNQFWIGIRKRNLWLIKLRFGAVLMLISLIVGFYILQSVFSDFYINTKPLWIIAISIFLYNILFYFIWQKIPIHFNNKFNSIHFSLIQISIDFIALLLFIYFTGGIETPLYAFFIFHVIIGSILLPCFLIYTITTITLIISITCALLELYYIIPHYSIQGFLQNPLYDNLSYLIIFFTLFTITLYISIYLANSIAKELYSRERSLTDAYQELENAEKTKSKYVMSVVHDLKTPIVAALTYIDMLLGGNLGILSKEHKHPIERSKIRLNHAINTINDILQISQIRLEDSIGNEEEIVIDKLLYDIYEEMKVLFQSKNIIFVMNFEQKNIKLKAEYNLLRLAISNIISNAYKYTDISGKVELNCKEDKTNIFISIADNGIGIPEKEKEKIFNEFYRSTISKTKGIEGTGLGMSIVVGILKRYGGNINVASPSYLATGKDRPGSEFNIILPKNNNENK